MVQGCFDAHIYCFCQLTMKTLQPRATNSKSCKCHEHRAVAAEWIRNFLLDVHQYPPVTGQQHTLESKTAFCSFWLWTRTQWCQRASKDQLKSWQGGIKASCFVLQIPTSSRWLSWKYFPLLFPPSRRHANKAPTVAPMEELQCQSVCLIASGMNVNLRGQEASLSYFNSPEV